MMMIVWQHQLLVGSYILTQERESTKYCRPLRLQLVGYMTVKGHNNQVMLLVLPPPTSSHFSLLFFLSKRTLHPHKIVSVRFLSEMIGFEISHQFLRHKDSSQGPF